MTTAESPNPDREVLAWHYTTSRGLQSILANHSLWATSAAFMNDADEMRTGRDAYLHHLETRKSEMSADLLQQIADTGLNAKDPVFSNYLLSASTSGDLLTMWRNYGGNDVPYSVGLERGVRLHPLEQVAGADHPHPPAAYYEDARIQLLDGGFVNGEPDRAIVWGGSWQTVDYVSGPNDVVVRKRFDELLETLGKQGPGAFMVFPTFTFPDAPTNYLKDAGFRDERETRAIWWVNPQWKFVRHRPSRFGLIPFIEVTAGFPQEEFARTRSPLPIRAITIGPSGNSDYAARSLKILLEVSGYSDVEIRRSESTFR